MIHTFTLVLQLPNVTTELENVRNAIRDVNLDQLIADGQQEFNNIAQSITSTVDENLGSESPTVLVLSRKRFVS